MRGLLLAVGLAGVVLLFVFPARTLLAQERSLHSTAAAIRALNQENRALAARSKALAEPAQIEQIAHSQYGLVLPGQKSYAILPVSSGTNATATKPASATRRAHHWWQTLEFWN